MSPVPKIDNVQVFFIIETGLQYQKFKLQGMYASTNLLYYSCYVVLYFKKAIRSCCVIVRARAALTMTVVGNAEQRQCLQSQRKSSSDSTAVEFDNDFRQQDSTTVLLSTTITRMIKLYDQMLLISSNKSN